MVALRSIPHTAAKAVRLVTDREQPWRRAFILFRIALKTGNPVVVRKFRYRLERLFPEHPQAIVPYLEHYERSTSEGQALAYACELIERRNTPASVVVEVAKFHYLHGALSLGDDFLERAKQIDPNYARTYDEEAWNQRARGNLHRELMAVRQSLELARDDATRAFWMGWLADGLMRQGKAEEAWQVFEQLPALAEGDDNLLIRAVCARKVGLEDEVAKSYRQYAPLTGGGFDLERVASLQLDEHLRPDEAAALLHDLDQHSSASLLELSFRAQVQAGYLDRAQQHLEWAVAHRDRAPESLGLLGQLLELLGRSDEALEVYRGADGRDRSRIVRFRLGALMHERGETAKAVTQYLAGEAPAAAIATRLLAHEVDPQLPRLVDEYNASLRGPSSSGAFEAIRQIAARASGQDLLTLSSTLLARSLADQGEWQAAWNAVVAAQVERQPTIPMSSVDEDSAEALGRGYYYECIETESLHGRTVLYQASLGANTFCNPLAITRELLRDPECADLLHVWTLDEGAAIHPSLLDRENVVFIRRGSPGYFRYLASAGYLVNNATFEHEFVKRDGQRYLNTWHGVPWKHMGRDNFGEPFAYGNIARNFMHADVVIGPDAHTLDVLSRGHAVEQLVPDAFVQCGYPRNDLAVNLSADDRATIRRALGVPDDGKLVLYMPTWKGAFSVRDAQVQEVIDTANDISTAGATVAVRAHHYVSAAFDEANPEHFVFVPPHFDTNELIGAADAVVTDFSSVLFDAAAVGVPVVKIIDGIDAYRADRGLYFSADEVPGANAETVGEARDLLVAALRDPSAFVARYADLTQHFSANETGSSARDAIDLLFADSTPAEPASPVKPVLLSTGGLPPNGITRSVRSLIAALHPTDYEPYLIPAKNTLDGAEPETLADLRRYSHVLPSVGRPATTRMELEALRFGTSIRYSPFPLAKRLVQAYSQREAHRLFGRAAFHAAVEFSAYDSRNIQLIGYGAPVRGGSRGIVLHNEMLKEMQHRFPRLSAGFHSLDAMQFCASVSDGVRDYNAATLFEHFGVPCEKHITIENTINVAEIRELGELPIDQADIDWYAQDGAHACVVARLSPEKNHAQFFDAIAACREDIAQPVRITCLGDGPLRLELERQIADLGLEDRVRLRGLVPNPQAHLKAAGAMVLPSLHEGQPLVILEALTVGSPVVATATPGSASVLHDGAFGPLVPLTFDGLVEAVHRIADGDLGGTEQFDPEAFTAHSLGMFTDAIDPS